MKDQALVSVIIATYNMGQYVPDAINSVLYQSWKHLEVIVIDDGSQDGTEKRMVDFLSDSRVRYIRTENRGQPKAKNLGVQNANGEFIAFCDADDLWHQDKLKFQMPSFENEDIGVVYSEVSYIDQDGDWLNKPQPYHRHSGKVTNELVIKNFVPFGTAVIRKACFEDSGFFNEELPMGIDWDLWLRVSLNWRFKYIPEKTYIYRVWPGQMSSNYRGRYDNAFKILRDFLENNPGIVSSQLEARAWSDMYAAKAISLARSEQLFLEPLKDIFCGLRHDFFYYPAWKSLAKLLLRRV